MVEMTMTRIRFQFFTKQNQSRFVMDYKEQLNNLIERNPTLKLVFSPFLDRFNDLYVAHLMIYHQHSYYSENQLRTYSGD